MSFANAFDLDQSITLSLVKGKTKENQKGNRLPVFVSLKYLLFY